MSASIAAVIAAGGHGSRMGNTGNKLLLKIGGKTVIRRTLEIFDNLPLIKEIILVTAQDVSFVRELEGLKKLTKIVPGGKTRQDSVYNGIMAAEGYEFIAVHDAARPLVTNEIIENTIKKAFATGAAVTGVKVIDTIKTIKSENVVAYTPDRTELFAAATPQVFRRDVWLREYHNNKFKATDDVSVIEQKEKVSIVIGSRENIKITTPFDILVAEAILKSREKAEKESGGKNREEKTDESRYRT